MDTCLHMVGMAVEDKSGKTPVAKLETSLERAVPGSLSSF